MKVTKVEKTILDEAWSNPKLFKWAISNQNKGENMSKGTKETYYNYIKKHFPNANFEVLEYTTSRKPAKVKCLDCGSILESKVASKIIDRYYFCKCKNEKKEKALKKSKQILEENLKKYFPKTELEILEWNSSYKPIIIKCKKCGLIKSYTNAQHIFKTKHFCECDKDNKKYNIEEITNMLPDKVKKEFEILNEVEFISKDKVKVKHKNCGFIFETKIPYLKFKDINCPQCQRKYSKGEKAIRRYLQNNNISFEPQYHFLNTEITKLSFDFKINYNNKIYLIEFQGQQHFTPIEWFGGEEKYKKQIEHDNQKRIFCKNNNYILIEILYSDLEKIEDILNNYFGSTTSS